MNTHSTVLDNASVEATTADRILQIALAAWRQGNFVEVVDQFDGQFTFTDHALGLEFLDRILGKNTFTLPGFRKKSQRFCTLCVEAADFVFHLPKLLRISTVA